MILYHSIPQDTGQGLETFLVVRTGGEKKDHWHLDSGDHGYRWTSYNTQDSLIPENYQPQKSMLLR